MQYFIYILYVVLAVAGMTLIKYGTSESAKAFFTISRLNFSVSKELLLGIICYGISFLMFMFAISKSKISIVIPVLSGIVNLAIIVTGIIIFKESIIKQQLLGALLIIIGTFLIGIAKG